MLLTVIEAKGGQNHKCLISNLTQGIKVGFAWKTYQLTVDLLFVLVHVGTDECLSTGSNGPCTNNQQCSIINGVFGCSCLDGYTSDLTDPDTCFGKKYHMVWVINVRDLLP